MTRTRWIVTLAIGIIGVMFLSGVFSSTQKEQALDFAKTGDFAEAEEVLDRVLQANPKDLEAIYFRGVCRMELRRTEEALTDFASIRSNKDWWDESFSRTVEALMADRRGDDAQKEVAAAGVEVLQSSLAQEAVGRYHLWEAQRGMDRIQKLLAPSIGDTPADRFKRYAERVVMAESKIYAASLDRMLERLVREHDFTKTALLTTIIDRAHGQLLDAHVAFKRAAQLVETDETQPAPLFAYISLADINETRRRHADFENNLKAIIALKPEQFFGEVVRESYLKGYQHDARLRLGDSRLKAGAWKEAIAAVEPIPVGKSGRRPYDFERIMAEAYTGLGDDEKAVEIARYWLKRQPKYPTVNFILGSFYFKQGDFDKAYPYLELAVGKRYNSRTFVPTYVECLLKLGKFDRANTVLDRVIEARPTDWEAVRLKAQAMEGMGWIEDTRTLLNRSLGRTFSTAGTEANRELRRFMEAFIKRNDLLPKNLHTAQVLYRQDKNNFDIGRRYLDLLVEAGAVENARALAEDLFERCPTNDSARYDVMMSTGRAFETIRRSDDAITCFTEAVQRRPWEAVAHVGIARNEVADGRIDAAARALEHAAALAPELAELHRIRFDILVTENRIPEALEEAQTWIRKGGDDRATLVRIADLLLQHKKTDLARTAIALIEADSAANNDERVDLALLQIRAGMDKKAMVTLDDVIDAPGFGVAHLTGLARKLSQIGRNDLVIKYLKTPVESDRELATEPVSLLAAAYRDTNQVDEFLNLLARLRRRGRNTESFTWTAQFCASRDADLEVLSICEQAVNDQAAGPQLLELGIETALRLDRPKSADSFYAELIRASGSSVALRNRMQARIQEYDGNFVGAVETLKRSLQRVSVDERSSTWMQLIDLLAENNQLEAMKKAVSEAIIRKEVPADYGAHAARLLVSKRDPSASSAIQAALKAAPQSADAWFDAGILALGNEELQTAINHLSKAWSFRPDRSSTHALALLAAVTNQRTLLKKTLQRSRGRYASFVPPESPAMAEMVHRLSQSRIESALAFAKRLTYPSVAERKALESLIAVKPGDKAVQVEFAEHLARFFVFASNKHTLRYAADAAERLVELRPEKSREIRLMRARALMGSDDTFNEGIRIVSRILEESEMRDEAGLSIYAQTYLKNGQVKDVERLVRFILSQTDFSDTFKIDLANTLAENNLNDLAALLLHTCTSDLPAKIRLEARTLFKAGHLNRAAELLKSRIRKEDRGFEYHQIVGTALVQKASTRREGFELLRQAVYRFGAIDDQVHLTLAREAYRKGDDDEGRKNVEAFLRREPASALRVIETLAVIQSLVDPDLSLTSRLEDRRLLLDPRGYYDQ